MKKLNDKQKAFIEYYLKHGNDTKAYKQAYDTKAQPNTIKVKACNLLKDPLVKKAIEQFNQDEKLIEEKILEIKQEVLEEKKSEFEKLVIDEIELKQKVLQEFARIAFFDIRKIFDKGYILKEVNKLDDDTAAALAAIKVVNSTPPGKDTPPEYTKEIKMWDKNKALIELAKYLGLFQKDNEQQGDTIINNMGTVKISGKELDIQVGEDIETETGQ